MNLRRLSHYHSRTEVMLALLAWLLLVAGIGLGSLAQNTANTAEVHVEHHQIMHGSFTADTTSHCPESNLHSALCLAACAVAAPAASTPQQISLAPVSAPIHQQVSALLLGTYVPPFRPPIA